jgi:hypothetical protein
MDDEERVRAIAGANVLAIGVESSLGILPFGPLPGPADFQELQASVKPKKVRWASSGTGLCYGSDSEGSCCLADTKVRSQYQCRFLGQRPETIPERVARDEQVFKVLEPAELMETPPCVETGFLGKQGDGGDTAEALLAEGQPKKAANTLTAVQREKMRRKETQAPQSSLSLPKPKVLDPQFAENMRKSQKNAGPGSGERKLAEKAWMTKLQEEDYSGPTLDRSRYLVLRNQTIVGNPRQTSEYRTMCREAVGVGEVPDMEKYAHLGPNDFGVMRWVVNRGSGCFWLPDTPRTTVKGFRHRLITRGPPVRRPLFRLNRPDTEWVEKAIAEDVQRGQLEKGSSDWGFPAFPTKEAKA